MSRPLCSILCAAAVLLTAATSQAEAIDRTWLFPEVALVQVEHGTSFVLPPWTRGLEEAGPQEHRGEVVQLRPSVPDAAGNTRLGELRQGLIQIAAVQPVTVEVGDHPVYLQPGVFQIRMDRPLVRVCSRDGQATWQEGPVVQPGTCLAVDISGPIPLEMLEPDQRGPQQTWVFLEQIRQSVLFEDDPRVALDRLSVSIRRQAGAERGDTEDLEAGGAAACLEGAGEGGDASGPEGPETPETEIDRTQHRIELDVTLEGL